MSESVVTFETLAFSRTARLCQRLLCLFFLLPKFFSCFEKTKLFRFLSVACFRFSFRPSSIVSVLFRIRLEFKIFFRFQSLKK